MNKDQNNQQPKPGIKKVTNIDLAVWYYKKHQALQKRRSPRFFYSETDGVPFFRYKVEPSLCTERKGIVFLRDKKGLCIAGFSIELKIFLPGIWATEVRKKEERLFKNRAN